MLVYLITLNINVLNKNYRNPKVILFETGEVIKIDHH